MRLLQIAAAAVLVSGAAHAQDVRGVLDNLNRALSPQQQQQEPSQRERQIRGDEERYWRDYYGNRDDWRDRYDRDFSRSDRGARMDDRDLDRVFRSEGARRIEYYAMNERDQRRYDNAPERERRQWNDDFAQNARERWDRLSNEQRRRYLDDVAREERNLSGSSSRRN